MSDNFDKDLQAMIDERDGAPVRLDASKFVNKNADLFGDNNADKSIGLDSSTQALTEDFSSIKVEDIDGFNEKEFALDPETIYDII